MNIREEQTRKIPPPIPDGSGPAPSMYRKESRGQGRKGYCPKTHSRLVAALEARWATPRVFLFPWRATQDRCPPWETAEGLFYLLISWTFHHLQMDSDFVVSLQKEETPMFRAPLLTPGPKSPPCAAEGRPGSPGQSQRVSCPCVGSPGPQPTCWLRVSEISSSRRSVAGRFV